jgi:serine/threonine protein kinase
VDPRRIKPGDVIDGFRVEETLPPGGMSNFWRVTRKDIDFPILMKVPKLEASEASTTIVGYETESMILPRLSGPHVPRFVATGDFERPYIVMEHVQGASLKSYLDKLPLAPQEVAAIGSHVAFALHDLHRQHVLHLDLKPSNVIQRADDTAVLIDFGLSHHLQLPDLIREEIEGPIGTAPYIAPEQVYGDRSDPRSDIFALGAILYFFATGERPHGDPQHTAGWKQRLWRDPVPPRRLRPDIPPALQEVILHCLDADPAARYATAGQVAFDLKHLDDVRLTERAVLKERKGLLRSWWEHRKRRHAMEQRQTVTHPAAGQAPIILAAVDLADAPLAQAIAATVRRLVATDPAARVACVNVLKTSYATIDDHEDAQGRNLHLQRLIELKHWSQAIGADPGRITHHVLEGADPAAVIVDYARNNRVDHIVVGARASSALRQHLGSVSTQVVARAPCTVTVVRRFAGTSSTATQQEHDGTA